MEHLPCGPHPIRVAVPYVGTEPYLSAVPFQDYPGRCGYSREAMIKYHDFRRFPNPKVAAAFLQTWLFFGLLISTFRVDIDESDFIRTDPKTGERLITTEKLPVYLRAWQERDGARPESERLAIMKKNAPNFRDAATMVWFLCECPDWPFSSYHPYAPVSPEVALSLALLGVALQHASRVVLGFEMGMQRTDIDGVTLRAWSTGRFLSQKMEKMGWCPFLLDGGRTGLDALYYAATFGPPGVKRNHRRCDDRRCLAVRYKEETYRSRHVDKDCGCGHVGPSIDVVKEVLDSAEGLPLLRWSEEVGQVEAVRYQPDMTYAAISHVWSDGLGNPHANTLPRCQLTALQNAVNNIYRESKQADISSLPLNDTATASPKQDLPASMPFWIDTLCVPVGSADKDHRKSAIQNMRDTYKNANTVLVIDSDIMTCSTASSDPMELLFRLNTSNWIRRLWTLQESIFALSVHLLVRDGKTVSLNDILRNTPPRGLEHEIHHELAREMGYLTGNSPNQRTHRWRHQNPAQPFPHVPPPAPTPLTDPEDPNEATTIYMLRAIISRTTTKISDEPTCLATLLSLPVRPILDTPPALRLQALFRALPTQIPPCIILLPGPRHEQPGFRWLPKTFLQLEGTNERSAINSHPTGIYDPTSSAMIERPSGQLTAEGLVVMFPGFLLGTIEPGAKIGTHFVVDAGGPEGAPARLWTVLYNEDTTDGGWDDVLAPQNHETVGIIAAAYGPAWVSTMEEALVAMSQKVSEGGVVVVRLVCRVLVAGVEEGDNQHWMRGKDTWVQGRWLGVRTRWCID